MILYFDTSIPEETIVQLYDMEARLVAEKRWSSHYNQSEELISETEKLIQANKSDKSFLKAVVVKSGPGSFTGLRVGITTANLIAFGLNIPVFEGQSDSVGEIVTSHLNAGQNRFTSTVMPKYDCAPTITRRKDCSN